MTNTWTDGGLESLILNHKGDRSFDDLSRACGGSPTGKRLHQIVSRPMKNFPDPETIKNIARGLNLPATEILLAAARSLGIRVAPSDETSLTLQEAGLLPRAQQQLLIEISRALIEGQEARKRLVAESPAEPASPTQDAYSLAAHKGHQGISPYDLPHE